MSVIAHSMKTRKKIAETVKKKWTPERKAARSLLMQELWKKNKENAQK